MGQRMSQSICCSVRDKNERARGLPNPSTPQFFCIEAQVELEVPSLCAFAPLWFNEGSPTKRLALAGGCEVHVYRITNESGEGSLPQPTLEHKLTLEASQVITSILFGDEQSSRHLVVAFGSCPHGNGVECVSCVRVWSCELKDGSPAATAGAVAEWKSDEGHIASLEGHNAPVVRIVTSPTYLLTADVLGECRVWQKNRSFQKRENATLHHGGIADLAVDRLFCYSAGFEDRLVCVWSVPELTPVLTLKVDIPQELIAAFEPIPYAIAATSIAPPPSVEPYELVRLTSLRRPLSRWAGAQGSSRTPKAPKGTLFVAGVLARGSDSSDAKGQGVLMEWSLGPSPSCQSAQIAHDTPITALVYGPYDNGPLITADSVGIFRVWDCVPRLNCSQQLEIGGMQELRGLAMAVEPQHGIYSIVGDKRLFIWRRHMGSDCEPR